VLFVADGHSILQALIVVAHQLGIERQGFAALGWGFEYLARYFGE
jgi:hypothetical protein